MSGTNPFGLRQRLGLFAGPGAGLLLYLLPAPQGMELTAWRVAAVGVWMAVWWMTEAVPIPVTALLPLVLFPALGAVGLRDAAAPYGNPLIFLFLGGFLIALAVERWGLHRRLALQVLRRAGARPRHVIAGFMAASAGLSMWISNTATTMMMLPIGVSVIALVEPPQETEDREGDGEAPVGGAFSTALMLSIAYAASVGGMATLIGTPPNALLAGFVLETYGLELGFARWMAFALPLVLVGLGLVFLVLTRWVLPVRIRSIPGGRELIQRQLAELGPMSGPEKAVAGVFALTAALWIGRGLVEEHLPGLSDTGIALFGALLLFVLPVDFRKGRFLLGWSEAQRLPWGVLLLFGGGLSLAGAIDSSGLAAWIGERLRGGGAWPSVLFVLAVVAVMVFLTELTSNTATTAAFLPVLASVATGLGFAPLRLLVPAALAASCAFMLPVATPPNAIVYGSGRVTLPQMARAGLWLNLLFLGLVTGMAFLVSESRLVG